MNEWKTTFEPASFWSPISSNGKIRAQCNLCPRQCIIPVAGFGFCGVRGNIDNRIYTFSYGKCVDASEEVIETEAVYHYAPGSRILSLGNIGCMMSCDFCQNWKTSQVAHLKDEIVRYYTPEQIVSICREYNIGIISWTYNDPVVWHEFVIETSRAARAHGIRTLYKSALYIREKPLAQLIDNIDIFSISLKSLNDDFYRKYTKAELAPVLENIRSISKSNRHLEISQLIVTGLNDTSDDIRQTIDWVLHNTGSDVPLHFVGFHPAYKYTHSQRTPADTLLFARDTALSSGIRHCYLGNVYRDGINDTRCSECGATLVQRFGLHTNVIGIDGNERCAGCGCATDIKYPFYACLYNNHVNHDVSIAANSSFYEWNDHVDNVHISVDNRAGGEIHPVDLQITHYPSGRKQYFRIGNGLSRAIVSRYCSTDNGINITWNSDHELILMPLKDRAHYPVENSINSDCVDHMELHNVR